jgi:hypothetical protein
MVRMVTHFDADNMVVLRDDGAVGIIIAIFDANGNQTTHLNEATSAVAKFHDGTARFDLGEYEKVTIH